MAHVLEPLSGYMLLIEHLYLHGNDFVSWNFGPFEHELKTVKEITKYLIEKWNHVQSYIIDNNNDQLYEAQSLNSIYLKLEIN